ncbi:hypothetical protein KCU88_g4487, partial [Aureobasidium melanogenum]
MSGAARRRGAGRATRGQASETSSRRGDRLQAPGGGFDGPASRGTGSGIGSQSRGPSNPSVGPPHGSGSAPQGSQAGSRRSSQSGGPPAQTAGPSVPVTQGDPARDEPSRYTDALRNVDLPASFYNIDQLVSAFHAEAGSKYDTSPLCPIESVALQYPRLEATALAMF